MTEALLEVSPRIARLTVSQEGTLAELHIEQAIARLTLSSAGPQGATGPVGPSSSSFEHTQAIASDTWTINHNLGFRPDVELRNAGGVVVWGELVHTSINQVVAYFATAISGTARCS